MFNFPKENKDIIVRWIKETSEGKLSRKELFKNLLIFSGRLDSSKKLLLEL